MTIPTVQQIADKIEDACWWINGNVTFEYRWLYRAMFLVMAEREHALWCHLQELEQKLDGGG